ncbi:MAG: lysophospholipid acyltransferase family protein, partial [Thermoanaerobaculia bacterium]
MTTARDALTYHFLRAAVAVVDRLPLSGAVWTLERVAEVWFAADRRRRRVAVENLLESGIVAGPRSARTLAWRSARHFGAVVAETLKSAVLMAEESWRDRVEVALDPATTAALADPAQGLLVASAHLGNWEIAAQVLSRFKPTVGAIRRPTNARLERLLHERKLGSAFRLTDEWVGNPRRFLDILAHGEALALLVDLDARGRGLPVEFFGRPAATHTTLPMLHLVSRAPVAVGYCLRTGAGRFRLESAGLVRHAPTGDRIADCRAILARIHEALETAIRRHPEQYLWAHSRWKHGHWRPGMR